MNIEELDQLRAAVAASPENLPIRKLYANALLRHKKYEEAEVAFKDILRLAPADTSLKIGLATAFYHLSKIAPGLVIMEEVVKQTTPPATAWMTYAKLLLKAGESANARDAYEKAIIINPSLTDAFFASELNLSQQKNNTHDRRNAYRKRHYENRILRKRYAYCRC